MSSYPSRRRQRLTGYDYTSAGFYFLTVCLQDRLPLLGHVSPEGFHPSPAGMMVQTAWEGLPNHFTGVILDTLIVMPDHLHAIVVLSGEGISLSAVVQRVKAYTTSRYVLGVRQEGWPAFPGRLWQRGFHDRIVRDERELSRAAARKAGPPSVALSCRRATGRARCRGPNRRGWPAGTVGRTAPPPRSPRT